MKENKMVDVSGLKPAHFDALEKVAQKQFRAIDGRLMRVLTRRGFAVATAEGNWKLTAAGRSALKAR
jgi:hypothetical protein